MKDFIRVKKRITSLEAKIRKLETEKNRLKRVVSRQKTQDRGTVHLH